MIQLFWQKTLNNTTSIQNKIADIQIRYDNQNSTWLSDVTFPTTIDINQIPKIDENLSIVQGIEDVSWNGSIGRNLVLNVANVKNESEQGTFKMLNFMFKDIEYNYDPNNPALFYPFSVFVEFGEWKNINNFDLMITVNSERMKQFFQENSVNYKQDITSDGKLTVYLTIEYTSKDGTKKDTILVPCTFTDVV